MDLELVIIFKDGQSARYAMPAHEQLNFSWANAKGLEISEIAVHAMGEAAPEGEAAESGT